MNLFVDIACVVAKGLEWLMIEFIVMALALMLFDSLGMTTSLELWRLFAPVIGYPYL